MTDLNQSKCDDFSGILRSHLVADALYGDDGCGVVTPTIRQEDHHGPYSVDGVPRFGGDHISGGGESSGQQYANRERATYTMKSVEPSATGMPAI